MKKEEYTIVSSKDDNGDFLDLRELEQTGECEMISEVLELSNISWKLAKITDLYEDIINTKIQTEK